MYSLINIGCFDLFLLTPPMMKIKSTLLLLVSITAFIAHGHAKIWLPSILGDNMILQAERPLSFWGKASSGDTVSVSIVDSHGAVISSGQAHVDAGGKWTLRLPELESGLNVSVDIVDGQGDVVQLSNVLIGEVWLCSGQSNMRWTVAKSKDAVTELANADHAAIRLFKVKTEAGSIPLDNLNGEWVVCSPETAGDFSGAGYFFGRDLQASIGAPVGLIDSAWGGTPVQAWIAASAMAANDKTETLLAEYQNYLDTPREQRKRDGRGDWIYGAQLQKAPGRLYNSMIHPLQSFPIRGVVWCQGEANDREGKWGGPSLYHTLFPMLIRSWREQWGQGDFPFIYVELANFMAPQTHPIGEGEPVNWAYIREAQASALALDGVYAVSAIDLGAADNIHYLDKQSVGARLALAAEGAVYQRGDSPSLSPRYLEQQIEAEGRVRLRFTNAEGLHTDDGQLPQGFAICDSAGEWYWAKAEIAGEDILVWHPDIIHLEAIRYAWASNPEVNVYNRSGLPLMPFRSDK
jgi:sialate O-acetylesterase